MDLLVPAITDEGLHLSAAEDAPFDPYHFDTLGRKVYFGELTVEMSPFSKQYEHASGDITDDIIKAWRCPTKAMDVDDSYVEVDGPPLAGAMVLRGSRCVLVRSLFDPAEWPGMKFPATKRMTEENESYLDAATRSLTQLCNIDPEEVIPLEDVPPIMINGNGCPYGSVLLHFFCAANPPPPGPLENADMEDDEDFYDWYTFPRAMDALQDQASKLALYTATMSLNVAAIADKVPTKWHRSEGGVFGQELFQGLKVRLAATILTRRITRARTSAQGAPPSPITEIILAIIF